MLESKLLMDADDVDGGEGYAIIDPDPDTVSEFERRQRSFDEERAELEEYRHVEARTRDGRRIEVSANLGSAEEAEDALAWGAEGVGLFRTEFLFMERDQLPSEEEQYEVYRKATEAFGEKPVIIRTLNVGATRTSPAWSSPRRRTRFWAGAVPGCAWTCRSSSSRS